MLKSRLPLTSSTPRCWDLACKVGVREIARKLVSRELARKLPNNWAEVAREFVLLEVEATPLQADILLQVEATPLQGRASPPVLLGTKPRETMMAQTSAVEMDRDGGSCVTETPALPWPPHHKSGYRWKEV